MDLRNVWSTNTVFHTVLFLTQQKSMVVSHGNVIHWSYHVLYYPEADDLTEQCDNPLKLQF